MGSVSLEDAARGMHYERHPTIVNLLAEPMAGVLLFFGLSLVGVGILYMGGSSAQSKSAVIGWGIIGAIFLGLECFVVTFASRFGSAFSGEPTGTGLVGFMIAFSVIMLGVYFKKAFARLKKQK
jgi:hypothetical protein